MPMRTTLAIIAGAAVMAFAAPNTASALPQAKGLQGAGKSNVEQVRHRYYRHNRHWRHGYYHRHRHYRRPGFGIYLGF